MLDAANYFALVYARLSCYCCIVVMLVAPWVVEGVIILVLCTIWEGATRQRHIVIHALELACDWYDHM